ncbi:LysM peptidoglycan-binding domain-containing protein [Pokkaliibacter sp. CJK22405]|uniref:LysM peptidoglycan-binding domain-containing protein n=1 Tax=Pokkaliibacter sp. CJK22405 TaxID=3384615 RepID=UPI003984B2B4
MRTFFVALLLLLSATAWAEKPTLRDGAPKTYTVVKGDTLWGITGRFFQNPWLWPQLWAKNPQIENPHWIYPGDTIHMVYVNGQPRLVVKRGEAGAKASATGSKVKLVPETRVSLLSPIPTLPPEVIGPFLRDNLIIQPGDLDSSPYVLGTDDQRLLSSAGQTLYVRGVLPEEAGEWRLYRPSTLLKEKVNGKDVAFGQEAKYIATLKLDKPAEDSDISTFTVQSIAEEVRIGDRLVKVPANDAYEAFAPAYPMDTELNGHILALASGVAYTGRDDIVILDRGADYDLQRGTILQINAAGETVKDPVSGDPVTLPDSRAGVLLVFKVFDHTSYALVIKAERTLHVGDKVVAPDF